MYPTLSHPGWLRRLVALLATLLSLSAAPAQLVATPPPPAPRQAAADADPSTPTDAARIVSLFATSVRERTDGSWNDPDSAVGSIPSGCRDGQNCETRTCSASAPPGRVNEPYFLDATNFESLTLNPGECISRVWIDIYGSSSDNTEMFVEFQIFGSVTRRSFAGLFGSACIWNFGGPDGNGFEITQFLGRPWTAADVNALQVGIRREARGNSNSPTLYVTGFRIRVEVLAAVAITQPPVNARACVGQTATFCVNASGDNLVYVWSRNGSPIPGANGPCYTTPPLGANDGGTYTVFVGNGCSLTSASASLEVLTPVFLIQPPASTTVCEGQPVTLSVVAGGSDLRYEWRKNGVLLPWATGPSIQLPAASRQDAGRFCVRFFNDCDSSPEFCADLVVNFPQTPTDATYNPASVTVDPFQNVVLDVSSSTPPATLVYQWKRNGQPLTNTPPYSGVNSARLTISPARLANEGIYTCTLNAVVCGQLSPPFTREPGVPVVIRCEADWDNNRSLDFNDILAFLNDFNAQAPRADLTRDGVIDFNDFLAFLNAFNTGC